MAWSASKVFTAFIEHCFENGTMNLASDTIKVALRPELLYLHPAGAVVENTLTGVVENVAFLGAVARIHLRVGDTTVLVDEFNNPQLSVPAIGSTLTTYFTPESCMVLG